MKNSFGSTVRNVLWQWTKTLSPGWTYFAYDKSSSGFRLFKQRESKIDQALSDVLAAIYAGTDSWPAIGNEIVEMEPGTHKQRAFRRQAVVMPMLKDKNWSRGRVVVATGMGKDSIYKYLDGTRKTISDKNRQAIADELGIKIDDLPE